MTTEEALNLHFVASGIYAEGCTRADWYPGNMVSLKLGRFSLPIFPVLRRDGPIVLHDIHHMITGYAPTWQGEAALAGWELGSGGCGWHLFYWLDRLTFALLGLAIAPVALARAFRRGLSSRNLFSRDPEEILRSGLDEVIQYARLSPSSGPRTAAREVR